MTKSMIFAGIVTIAVILGGCSGKLAGPEYEYGVVPLADSIQWQSLSVVWEQIPDKKPASMLVVATDWCQWCRKLKEETLRDRSVIGLLEKYFNSCIIDADSDSLVVVGDSTVTCRVAAREVFGVTGYPTTVFFDSHGKRIGSLRGYQPAKPFADMLWQVVETVRQQ